MYIFIAGLVGFVAGAILSWVFHAKELAAERAISDRLYNAYLKLKTEFVAHLGKV